MNKRELCKSIAAHIGGQLPNSDLARRFKEAGHGLDEDALKAIDLTLSYYETLIVREQMLART